MTPKPALRSVPAGMRDSVIGLARTTAESRKMMSVPELIAAMGSLHVNHPDFVQRPRSLLPIPNLADVQPMIQRVDPRIIPQIKAFIAWILA